MKESRHHPTNTSRVSRKKTKPSNQRTALSRGRRLDTTLTGWARGREKHQERMDWLKESRYPYYTTNHMIGVHNIRRESRNNNITTTSRQKSAAREPQRTRMRQHHHQNPALSRGSRLDTTLTGWAKGGSANRRGDTGCGRRS